MRRIGATIVAALAAGWPLVVSAGQAADQSSNGAITVSDARTPEAPAFVLLGVSPTQIERPTTPRALAISVVSASLSGDNLIPQHYAVQVAPYWLRSHPTLTNRDYYNPSIAQSILQRLSMSVVSTRISTVDGQRANATQLGVGLYTAIAAGHGGPAVRRLTARIHALQLELLAAQFALEPYLPAAPEPPPTDAAFQALVDAVSKTFDATKASAPSHEQEQAYALARKRLLDRIAAMWTDAHREPSASAFRSSAAALVAAIEAELAKAVGAVHRADEWRRGFQLSVAGASAWTVPDTGVADRRLARWGIWATPSYRPDALPIDLIAVVRAVRRPSPDGDTLLDVGGRVTQQTSILNWSVEYVARRNRADVATRASTERAAAVLDVRAHDDMYVTASFGKDFAEPARGRSSGSLFTTLGLALGFGEKPTIVVR